MAEGTQVVGARLVAVSIGSVERLGVHEAADRFDEAWTTGIFKAPVTGPITVRADRLAGDEQADASNHGGPDKAICVYSGDHHPAWQAIFGRPVEPGGFGENFTVVGLTEPDVCIGDIWLVGDARLQVSQPRQPCWKLARKWRVDDLVQRVVASGRTGWYLRVLEEGTVAAGGSITLVARSHPQWTIEAANAVMHFERDDREGALALARVEPLSTSWKRALLKRAGVDA